VKRLRKEGKINEQFEVLIGNLTLEEVIAVKLELSSRSLSSPLYGLPLWKNLTKIVKEAVLLCAMSITRTQSECARYLGVTYEDITDLIKKHDMKSYYGPNYYRAWRERENAKNGQEAVGEHNSDDSKKVV